MMKMDSCKLKELMSINIDPSGLYAKGDLYAHMLNPVCLYIKPTNIDLGCGFGC